MSNKLLVRQKHIKKKKRTGGQVMRIVAGRTGTQEENNGDRQTCITG
jgi:hypothetical protein